MRKFILPFLIIPIWGCSQQTEPIPEQLHGMENLTVYSANAEPAVNISFQKEVVYGETDEVLIRKMGEVAVDSSGRVFIAEPLQTIILAFEPNGQLIGQFGGAGAGPGEFDWWVQNVQIHNHHLYALDANRHRIHIFSLDSFEVENTVSLASNRSSYRELARAYPDIDNLYVRGDGTYIAEFLMHATHDRIERYESIELKSLYYLLESNGSISNGLFEFTREKRTNLVLIVPLYDFFGHVLRGFSSKDHIYLAAPDNFLVKTYSPDGDYLHAFFYPFRKIPLTRETAAEAGIFDTWRVSGEEISLIEKVDLPETWPVLTDMKIDDQDRLWIATTVEEMSIYEWWVLEETGELITRFEWPRNEPIEVVKNGYMYTRETDEETGLQQIVRYRIEFEEV